MLPKMTPEEVRRALGQSAYPEDYTPAEPETPHARRTGDDLARLKERVSLHERFIVCRFMEGFTPEIIASLLAVHPETIRMRLRAHRLFASSGRRGKVSRRAATPLVAWYREGVAKTYEGMIPSDFLF